MKLENKEGNIVTQEEKQLVLIDLSARLPFGVKIELTWWVVDEGTYFNATLEPDHIEQLLNDECGDTEIKPYLRPLSSMTEEETKEYKHLVAFSGSPSGAANFVNWLNAHHFDYRTDDEGKTLIEKGLALIAPEGMYNMKKE